MFLVVSSGGYEPDCIRSALFNLVDGANLSVVPIGNGEEETTLSVVPTGNGEEETTLSVVAVGNLEEEAAFILYSHRQSIFDCCAFHLK